MILWSNEGESWGVFPPPTKTFVSALTSTNGSFKGHVANSNDVSPTKG